MALATRSVALFCLGVVCAVQAQVTSVNGQIAYVACGPSSIPFTPDQCDIWVMNQDGTGQTNLTDSPDKNETSPAWSPDGRRIAYFEGWGPNTLMTMDADGTHPIAHTTTSAYPYASTPTWSPGGTQIAFVANKPGSPVSIQADVVAIDLQTGVETVISRPASFGGVLLDADEIEPAWSPLDGGKIAFAGVRLEQYRDPVSGELTEGAQWEIVIANPDGSGEQIVSAGDPGTDRAEYLEEDRAPAWSPDGRMLVFMSQAQIPSCCGPWQIWAVNRDGTGATNLTNDESVNDGGASWSPDGTQIIFSRSNGQGGIDLYAMPAPTSLPPASLPAATKLPAAGVVTRLTLDGNASDPDWGRNPEAPPPSGQKFTLIASISAASRGAGGIVASLPRGIWCGRYCSKAYAPGTQVALIAIPYRRSEFVGWSGACAGPSRICIVSMSDVKTVQASFARLP